MSRLSERLPERTGKATRVAGVEMRGPEFGRLVHRPRLIRQLERSNAPLVVLVAPAGYGKSVLLAQWAMHDPRPFASITITEAHNDPAFMFISVIEALDGIEAIPEGAFPVELPPDPSPEALLTGLEYAIHASETPMVLVLDELEHVDDVDCLRLLEAFAQSMPHGSRLALAARSVTLPHMGRLRASRQLTELGRKDLVMTRRECRQLLSGIGLDPSPGQLDVLVGKTEGWPATLYLAGLSLAGEPDLGAAVDRFAGDERILVDYIGDVLLAQQPRACVDFLTRASVLDRFTGDLCDAVLGRSGSGKALRDLSRGNMVLIPLDRRDEWFRFHSLLSDVLRSELQRSAPAEIPELHRRASAWWSGRGDAGRAIHHSIEAGDLDRAGELIWAAVPEFMARGCYGKMRQWLDRIGPERLATDPHLSLTVAHGHLSRGEGGLAEHWGAVTRGRLRGMRASEREPLEAGLALLDAALARGGVVEMSGRVDSARRSLSEEGPWLSECSLIGGIASHLAGRRRQAHEMLAEGARSGAIWGTQIIQVLSLAQLALLVAQDGDWHSARMLASQARSQVERSGLGEYPTMALVYATSAYVRARQERGDEAGADLRTALGLLARLDRFGSWYEAETRATLAATATALNDVPLAADLLEDAARFSKLTTGAPALEHWIEEIGAAVGRISADSIGDLTAAELRVLRFLPTHLSFPEIAAELYVSPNTVKTQAQAAYRKLGVSSRREAVERAREVGLLGSDPFR